MWIKIPGFYYHTAARSCSWSRPKKPASAIGSTVNKSANIEDPRITLKSTLKFNHFQLLQQLTEFPRHKKARKQRLRIKNVTGEKWSMTRIKNITGEKWLMTERTEILFLQEHIICSSIIHVPRTPTQHFTVNILLLWQFSMLEDDWMSSKMPAHTLLAASPRNS